MHMHTHNRDKQAIPNPMTSDSAFISIATPEHTPSDRFHVARLHITVLQAVVGLARWVASAPERHCSPPTCALTSRGARQCNTLNAPPCVGLWLVQRLATGDRHSQAGSGIPTTIRSGTLGRMRSGGGSLLLAHSLFWQQSPNPPPAPPSSL